MADEGSFVVTRARNAAWLAVWTALAVAAGVVVVVILEAWRG